MPTAASPVLTSLVDWLGAPAADLALQVRDIHIDSRQVGEGDVFIALRGEQTDGRHYVGDAVSQGAVAVVIDESEGSLEQSLAVPVITVPGLGKQLGSLSARFYGPRYEGVRLFAVTGTNGKTTVAQLLAQLLNTLGEKAATIGTLGWGFADALREPGLTTPDVVSVHRVLARISEQGGRFVAMEVSSHGLAQNRISALGFDGAMLTNLSRDHLDYHGDMQSYAAQKRKLFLGDIDVAVLNVDDEFGRALYCDDAIKCSRMSYSLSDTSADLHCRELRFTASGCQAMLVTPWGESTINSPLLGDFNLSNLLGSLALLLNAGFGLAEVSAAVSQLCGAPGRMSMVRREPFGVLVDYAHTPDALEKVLTAVRPHTSGKLRVVLGCGGDRDKGKRGPMAALGEALSDQLIITSDNPRSEDPLAIIADMVAGLGNPSDAIAQPDRALAIQCALQQGEPGDLVVIAGKGHEEYQEIQGQRLPFSDQRCVEAYYAGLH